MELEIARIIALCILSLGCFIGCVLAIIRALDYKDRYKSQLRANQMLLKENVSLKAKLNCMDFYANEEKENKKVGKK